MGATGVGPHLCTAGPGAAKRAGSHYQGVPAIRWPVGSQCYAEPAADPFSPKAARLWPAGTPYHNTDSKSAIIEQYARVDQKEEAMPKDSGLYSVAAKRVPLPSIAVRATFKWDGIETAHPFMEPPSGTVLGSPHLPIVPSFTLASWQAPCLTAAARHVRSSLIDSEMGCADSSPSQPIDWEKEAASLTIYLDPRPLLVPAHDMVPRVTGELVWVYRRGRPQLITLYVRRVLLVGVTYGSHQLTPSRLSYTFIAATPCSTIAPWS